MSWLAGLLCLGLLSFLWAPASFTGPSRRIHGRDSSLLRRHEGTRSKSVASQQSQLEVDLLDAELFQFAEALLPRPKHKKQKTDMVRTLERIAQQAVSEGATIYPFGSSLNGCGEASSDIDLVLHIPPKEAMDLTPQEVLHKVAFKVEQGRSFNVLERRMKASVPIIVLEYLEDRRPTGFTCDVCFQRLLPLHNTRLLRTYMELAPNLVPLVLVVKSWAKRRGIAGTWEKFISTYSWTLVAIYYCQVVHGLPSLHSLEEEARKAKDGGNEDEDRGHESAFNCRFMDLKGARKALAASPQPLMDVELGELLRGFFQFYSGDYPDSFDWSSEVISVRLGERKTLGDPAFRDYLSRTFMKKRARRISVAAFPAFNIEDPIEVEKNLNFALNRPNFNRILNQVKEAEELLTTGGNLEQLLGMRQLPVPEPRRGRKPKAPWSSGFLPLGKLPPKECGKCGMKFEDFDTMLEHEHHCSPLSRLLASILA